MPQLIDQPDPLASTAKPAVSEKKLAANRANAQKSTGPRTDAGKAASRRNAAKHFMSGDGTVLSEELNDEIDRETAAIAARHAPADSHEWRLVREAAVASVRFDRLVQIQEANLVVNVNKAVRTWDEQREDRVAVLASMLSHDPSTAVRLLKRFTEGCDFLWDAWDALHTKLKRAGFWDVDDYRQALHLLGLDSPPTANAEGPAVSLTLCALGARLDRAEIADQAADFYDLDPDQAAGLLPSPDESLNALLGLVEQFKADLQDLADRLWNQTDSLDRAGAPTRALVDLSPDGKRLHRYEQDALRLRDRALSELKTRRQGPDPTTLGRSSSTKTMAPIPRTAPPSARNEPKPAGPVAGPTPPEARNEPTVSPSTASLLRDIVTGKGQTPPQNHPQGPPVEAQTEFD